MPNRSSSTPSSPDFEISPLRSEPGLSERPRWVKVLKLDAVWQPVWQFCLRCFLERQEPKIYWKRDRQGNSYYEVYDPLTRQRQNLASVREVRAWLEQRYYS
jgi:hypothetical protein